MERKYRKPKIANGLFLFSLCLCVSVVHAWAQSPWSGILDPSRATDWTQAGIQGGIPSYSTVCKSLVAGTDLLSGMSNAAANTTAIQNAVNSTCAGTSQAVIVPAGTWYIAGLNLYGSNVVLRGAGPDKTILISTTTVCSSNHNDIRVGNPGCANFSTGSTQWVAGYAKGATNITVTTNAGISATAGANGNLIGLSQDNDDTGTLPSTLWNAMNGSHAVNSYQFTPTLTLNSCSGTTSFSYVISAQVFPSTSAAVSLPPSQTATTSAACATLNATSTITISTPVQADGTAGIELASTVIPATCSIYRTASGGSPSTTGKIGSVACGSTFTDNGAAGDGTTPPAGTPGLSEAGTTVTVNLSLPVSQAFPAGLAANQLIGVGTIFNNQVDAYSDYDGLFKVASVGTQSFTYTDNPIFGVKSGSWASGTATLNTSLRPSAAPPGSATYAVIDLLLGHTITVSGATPSCYNGNYTVASVSDGSLSTTITYSDANCTTGTASASGGTVTDTSGNGRTNLAASGGEFVTTDTGGDYVCEVAGICDDTTLVALGGPNGGLCAGYSGQSAGCLTGEISERSQVEYKQVTAITNGPGSSACGTLSSGQSCLTITPPLEHNNWRASQNPAIFWTNSVINSFGMEGLTLDSSQDGNIEDAVIQFENTENCWLRNVRVLYAGDSFVYAAYNNLRLDVVDSYFFGIKHLGINGYGINTWGASDLLVQNNIFDHANATMWESDSGSVFAYNYTLDGTTGGVGTLYSQAWANHGSVGYELFEGNDANSTHEDDTHGGATAQTFFRNRLRGQDTPATNNYLTAVYDDSHNRVENFVGNVIGTAGIQTTYQGSHFLSQGAESGYVWVIGGTTGTGSIVQDDPVVSNTLLRWGNYDVVNGSVQWNSSEIPTSSVAYINGNPVPSNHTLPVSFYLGNSQPAWWATPWGTPHWPAIGPDVIDASTGAITDNPNTASFGQSDVIPAQLCFRYTPVDPSYQQSTTVTSATATASNNFGWQAEATLTLSSLGTLSPRTTIKVSGVSVAAYNGTFQVDCVAGSASNPGGCPALGANQITYGLMTSLPGAGSGGTVGWPSILLFNAKNCYGSEGAVVAGSYRSGSGYN